LEAFDGLVMLGGGFVDFIQQGGWVLWLVFCTCLLLWLCIFERLWFFRFEYPGLKKNLLHYWQHTNKTTGWAASVTRQLLLSEISLRLNARVRFIQTLIIICPLMGLLGTVTGMINLFDLIALNGNSDVKAMSAGIYRAILPTLAGLLVGLSGYYFALRFGQKAERSLQALSDSLPLNNNATVDSAPLRQKD
jgi:biopolymer transport protein ExbB